MTDGVARVVVAQLRLKLSYPEEYNDRRCSGKGGGGSTEIETCDLATSMTLYDGVARVVVAQLRLKPHILQIGDPKRRGKGGGGSTEIETEFDLLAKQRKK